MNVIVIMSDSLRKDHLGCYGNDWMKTPNIDKFASNGIVFDHAYSEGLPTTPVRTSLFTGRYTLPFRGWQPLEEEDILLSEVLWDKACYTAFISDTYHLHKPLMGFNRGFDFVQWIRGQESDPYIIDPEVKVDLTKFSERDVQQVLGRKAFEQYLRNTAHWRDEEDHFAAQVVKAGARWLERQESKSVRERFFLWLDIFDPHDPWDPPSPYRDLYSVPEYDGPPITWGMAYPGDVGKWTLAEIRHIRAQYAGEVTMVDKWIGVFLEKVDELGLLGNTLIFFLSDHGEPLGEHGIIKKSAPWPYEELSHVPLILRLPDGTEKGKHIDEFVGMPDVMPTVLDFLGIKGPGIMHGKSLLRFIQGYEKSAPFGISGYYGQSWSIRNREWSYYTWFGPHKVKVKPELYRFDPNFFPPKPSEYELERDLPERDDLIEKEPEIARSLELEMRQFIDYMLHAPSLGDRMAIARTKRRGFADFL